MKRLIDYFLQNWRVSPFYAIAKIAADADEEIKKAIMFLAEKSSG